MIDLTKRYLTLKTHRIHTLPVYGADVVQPL